MDAIRIQYDSLHDSYSVVVYESVVFVSSDPTALLEWVGDWASTRVSWRAELEWFRTEYGALSVSDPERALDWSTVLAPYRRLNDWNTVRAWFQMAYDLLYRIARGESRERIVLRTAAWFKATGERGASLTDTQFRAFWEQEFAELQQHAPYLLGY